MSARCSPEFYDRVRARADAAGVSLQDYVLTGLEWVLEQDVDPEPAQPHARVPDAVIEAERAMRRGRSRIERSHPKAL
jgi:hypothetical protein